MALNFPYLFKGHFISSLFKPFCDFVYFRFHGFRSRIRFLAQLALSTPSTPTALFLSSCWKLSNGEIELEVPRDRNSEFEPMAIKKRRRSISSFDDKIISMYAKGMTVRDIQSHVQELYRADMSAAMISNITEKVIEVAIEWQARPLQAVYPIVFFDAIHYKVKEGGKVVSKAAYICLGINLEGKKDILGLGIGESEGALH